ncbi:type VI secretion system baseplate subunit TssF [Paracidobacterium acidisoli]|uniref:Type VI secretion system baseplate subunit TssF n=1 Tax=Paracidobacterium acidisoli TaxID=2303751 RepID=A0A372IR04_9BACT|nr:type VI secretion system baseplate subunit TssF [Paracidobacterium acidisoli]MBT9330204.1 type VI secretion system baseplate subunit TssF [Paracidobacterium acidisoli]
MREELLEYYERELAYIRQLGAEFSQKYPRVASRLLLEPDRCDDPHVERLIESFAFMAARVHLRIDDDFPEVTAALLNLVAPHYLRSIPSMTIVECQLDPEQGKQTAGLKVPAGTHLATKRTFDSLPCRFRTAYNVELWPFTVSECEWRQPERLTQVIRVPGAVGVIRMRLQCAPDVSFEKLELDMLRFHLTGDTNVVHTLYELFCRNCIAICVRDPQKSNGPVSAVPVSQLAAMGFEEDEALLPYPRRSFSGYRLLQEYFTFSEKFLFFELDGLKAIAETGCREQAEILFYFSRFDRPERSQDLEVGVTSRTLRPGCTPVINLFSQTAEPILVSHTKHEYEVIPDVRHQETTEIFSVDDVLASNTSRRESVELEPLYSYRFQARNAAGRTYWHSVRRGNPLGEREPSRLFLSLVDIDGQLTQPDAEVLTVRCTCSNFDLPSRLPYGAEEGDFSAEDFPAVQRITALRRPTPSYDPPAEKGQLWRLASQLSLNYLSLVEEGLSAFQEILRLHNFTESAHLENQIGGIIGLNSSPHFAVMQSDYGNIPARGTRIEMEFDERQFVGGGVYLFAGVLNHFLGSYTSINSFCQFAARTNQRKEVLGEWPPRAGNKPLI